MGSVLCHSIGKHGVQRCNLDRVDGLCDRDTIIFCFGEIDVRCHVHKRVCSEGVPHEHIIDSLVENYFRAIQDIVERCEKKCLDVGVFNIPPPSRNSIEKQNIHYPYQGTDDERKMYTVYMNMCLKKACHQYAYTFVDIYNDYVDAQGSLNVDTSDGGIHIGDGKYLDSFMSRTFKRY
jgi:hypothetical protein